MPLDLSHLCPYTGRFPFSTSTGTATRVMQKCVRYDLVGLEGFGLVLRFVARERYAQDRAHLGFRVGLGNRIVRMNTLIMFITLKSYEHSPT